MILGHLDTSELDELTARAVHLLAAADVVAAEGQMPRKPERRWRDPAMVALVMTMLSLLVIALSYHAQVGNSAKASDQRSSIAVLQQKQNELFSELTSCVEPTGKCSKANAQATEALIQRIEHQIDLDICAGTFPDRAGQAACLARIIITHPSDSAPTTTP